MPSKTLAARVSLEQPGARCTEQALENHAPIDRTATSLRKGMKMNTRLFDELSKLLDTRTSRRQALKAMLASVVGGALGLRRGRGSLAVTPAPNPNDCGAVGDYDSLWEHVSKAVSDCEKAKNCASLKIYPSEGYAQEGASPNFRMVATDRITGIECPKLWKNQTPHYWELAWKVTKELPSSVEERIGMAMNAKFDHMNKPIRDYNQLHIHVSCMRTDVWNFLDQNDAKITTNPGQWKGSTLTIGGDVYRVLRLDAVNDLAQQNLFELLRNMIGNDPDMQYQTLVVSRRKNGGFYVMNSQSNMPNGTGAGEKKLLNEKCS